MPFGPSPPRFKPGQRANSARQLNAPLELLARLHNYRSAGGTMWTPAGPFDRGEGLIYRIGMTGDDGIPKVSGSIGTGKDVFDVTLQLTDTYTFSITQEETTYQGFNLSSQDVAANTTIISMWLWGMWMTIWEDCQTSS
jgi:hypothetical protein